MVKIAVDAMGGDNAPGEIVAGAVMAAQSREDIQIFLIGKEEVVSEELKKHTYKKEQIEVVNATEVIETETASREIMATDRREDLATDRRDRKMVIEMAVMKEKTTIIKKVSRVIAAAVIVLEVIETIDRTVRIVQERREDA